MKRFVFGFAFYLFTLALYFWVLAAEARQRKKLGHMYEGPDEGWDL